MQMPKMWTEKTLQEIEKPKFIQPDSSFSENSFKAYLKNKTSSDFLTGLESKSWATFNIVRKNISSFIGEKVHAKLKTMFKL